jgi:hypothetical protein
MRGAAAIAFALAVPLTSVHAQALRQQSNTTSFDGAALDAAVRQFQARQFQARHCAESWDHRSETLRPAAVVDAG